MMGRNGARARLLAGTTVVGLLFAAVFLVVAHGTAGAAESLVVGTSADFPPMEFRDPKNPAQFTGFEVQMVNDLMGHLGLKHEWKDMAFNGLLPAVQAGHVDLVASDVYVTPERQKVVDFVPYMESGLALMAAAKNASTIKGYADLCGKSLGVLAGSPPESTAANAASAACTGGGKPAIKISTFHAVSDELPQLDNGRLDAILEDLISLGYAETKNPGKYKVVYVDPATRIKVGFVLKQGSPLKAKLESALQWYMSSGRYKQTAQKWGMPASSLLASP